MAALFTEQVHEFISKLFLLLSIPTYVITRYVIIAPFGRHVQDEDGKKYRWWYGPQFDAKLSWFLFECPNLCWAWYCYFSVRDPYVMNDVTRMVSVDNNQLQISTNTVLLALFTLHYINRAILYPLRMNSNIHRVPLIITISACNVTILNGYIQCFYLVRLHKLAPLSLPPSSWINLQCWLGIMIFVVGMTINIQADGVLRDLRRQRNRDGQNVTYYIPKSPLFTYVSCPNFLGEILEWFGFSIASQFSLPAVAFFIYTLSNLVPRGVAHQKWYQNKFEDYPKDRKWAVIPFVV